MSSPDQLTFVMLALSGMPSLPDATSLTVADRASVWPSLDQAAWMSENVMVNVSWRFPSAVTLPGKSTTRR